ncbi:hypothetical protein GO495_04945 [Chitinophaga oryziterrae]|uniref:Exo-alpha-sialidase n=1 Tax=Chitinophaga oryziterrae TaxID=1031224 RepID=A0A6N8J6R4_9BACT|nr:glycoside hydrolase [Chitinophaga oryziterrae]MVT39919.1 hypothetical protein [Chitinophaga oryziterrae]
MTTSVFALEKRLEVFAVANLGAANIDILQIERIVSYDNGSTWVNNWVPNQTATFSSSVAAAITGDSLDTFVVGRRNDDHFWFGRLEEYYEFKTTPWAVIGAGTFYGKPAICSYGNSVSGWQSKNTIHTSYDGVRVLVFGQGKDNRIWWASSVNGGQSWHMAWQAIGTGTFTSSPAATCSTDGKLVAVFGKGKDDRIWWAYSTNGASSWDMAWSPIGEALFTSAPAAVCSADGKRIYAFGKGKDNRIWWAYATNGVQKWDMAWKPIGEGIFTSMPSVSCSWDGKIIHVFGEGNDNRIWQARSNDFGATWDIAWRKINDKQFNNVNDL